MKLPEIFLALLFTVPIPGLARDQKRPNILFVIVDDQSPFDLKAYRPDSILDTPTIDRLAAEGMTIDGAYQMGSWTGGVCTASRHMIMSGRTLWHIPDKPGRLFNPWAADPSRVPADLAEQTMAAVFNAAGYDTMRTCKQGNSYEGANEKFAVRRDASKRGGTPETGSAWHGDQVMDYLAEREEAKDEDPFLIYFGFSHPHDTRDGTPELLEKYGAVNHVDPDNLPPADDRQPPLPNNYLPGHPFPDGHPDLRDEYHVSGVWEKRDERTIRNEIGRQYACVEYIDQQIARVLGKLEAMGELDNTYVFYTSDHGMAIGRHGLQGKQNLYEHTWRVPMIVRGPGIAAGSRARGNAYLADVLPTLCDMAKIDTPETIETTSFLPVLEGKEQTVRDTLYGAYSGGTRPGMRAVRKGDWKLIQYDVLEGKVHEKQLFNLAENPWEFLPEHGKSEAMLTDLAEDPAHAEKLAEMEAVLLEEMRLHDDPYRLWDQPDDGLNTPLVPPAPKKPVRKKKQK